MEFLVSANTDKGLVKDTNQDGMSVKVLNTKQGKMVFAILCDGMGVLQRARLPVRPLYLLSMIGFVTAFLSCVRLLLRMPLSESSGRI